MPELADVSYSRETTIAAVSDYYNFLTKLYLKDDQVIYPPLKEDGPASHLLIVTSWQPWASRTRFWRSSPAFPTFARLEVLSTMRFKVPQSSFSLTGSATSRN